MFFAIVCFDKPGVEELRERTRPRHLAYISQNKQLIHVGGQFETAAASVEGLMIVVDVPDLAAAETFIEHEPFHNAGIYETVLIRRWRNLYPRIGEEHSDQAVVAREQLVEEGISEGQP